MIYLVIALAAMVTLAGPGPAPEAGAVRDALDRYLRAYEPELSALVADEEMNQRTREDWKITNRRLVSEVAFVALPGDAGWLGFRRVKSVNRKAVSDTGPPLAVLMSEGTAGAYEAARRLLAESAAHNLGAARTINLPNLPLELLHPRHRRRFTHEVDGTERVRGSTTVRLRFTEVGSPTLIQQPGAGDMRTTVLAWIEPGTGRLHRAWVTTRDVRHGRRSIDAMVKVEFAAHALGLLVPTRMDETFFVARNGEGVGTAKYTNYRRFQTGGRVVGNLDMW